MEDNYKNNMVFGIHPVLELIRSQKEIEKVYIQGGTRSPEIAEIANTCRANGVPVQFVPIEKMNRLTRKNHQGVVAFICPIEYQPLEKVVQMVFEDGRDPFILMLDRVTDVRNFGAIARTAYAAGVDAIVIPNHGSASINGDAMKTSAGALSLINVCLVVDQRVPRGEPEGRHRFPESQRIACSGLHRKGQREPLEIRPHRSALRDDGLGGRRH